MKKVILGTMVLLLMSLTGCNSEEIKGVEWYKAPENKQALEEKLAWCRQHKEKQGVEQNCINAETAYMLGGKMNQGGKIKEPKGF